MGREIRSRRQGPIQGRAGWLEERGTRESEEPGSRLTVIYMERQREEESSPYRSPLVR